MRAKTILLIACLSVLSWTAAVAQDGPVVEITQTSVDYLFQKSVHIQARFTAGSPVEEAFVLLSSDRVTHTEAVPAELKGEVLELEYALENDSLPAFSTVTYRFRMTLEDGSNYLSPEYSFLYEDNRFEWDSLLESPFRVYWYQGELPAAQSAIDIAESGVARARLLLPDLAFDQDIIHVYMYATATEMQQALEPGGELWVAGRAFPDEGLILVTLPPGPEQRLLMEQRIPHEVMHILLAQTYGEGHANLPTWIVEGLASSAELYPSPDYAVILDGAYERDGLVPITGLCDTFPREASTALLAYAQSASFVRFLHESYGSPALASLLNAYARGMTCERAPEVVLGKSLLQLEREWRQQTFSDDATVRTIRNLLPWAVLIAAIFLGPTVLLLNRSRN